MTADPRIASMHQTAEILTLGAALLATAAQAAEGYAAWDNFNGATRIDTRRWLEPEERLLIEGGAMHVVRRSLGSQYANSGANYESLRNKLANPAPVTRMRTVVTVNAAEVSDCGANKSAVIAGLGGQFFNAGGSAPTSQANDVAVEFQVLRMNSDPAGVLQVSGFAWQCNDGDCRLSTGLGGVSLGSVLVGQKLTLRLDWDTAGNRFGFTLNSDPTAYLNYVVSDSRPAYAPVRWLGVRTAMANCLSGPRTEGIIDVTFDNLNVNASAVPP